MKRTRAVDCGCGHRMQAVADDRDKSSMPLGEKLFQLVREHVDETHPELNLSNRDIWILLAEKAYTPEIAR